MRRRFTLLAGLVLGLAAFALPAASAQAAAPVAAHCGDRITRNAYLTSDLHCSGAGLTLAASVDLDLRGHVLDGGGTGTALSLDGESSPTVRNGTVSGWTTGIDGSNPTDGTFQSAPSVFTVSSVMFTGNGRAIDLFDAFPIDFGWATNFSVADSVFDHNGRAIGGVFVGSTTVADSVFTDNDEALHIDTGGVAVTGSRFSDNGRTAYCLEARCSIADSTVTGGGTGLQIVNADLALTDSAVSGVGTGVVVTAASATVTDNRFSRNKTAVRTDGADLSLARNRFLSNEYGYRGTGAGAVTLVANSFLRNGDGVLSSTDGIRLRSTTALANRRHGIKAPLALDLGRNVAYGNGSKPQCVGVACRPSR